MPQRILARTPPDLRVGSTGIRVLSVPADHRYVRHAIAGPGVELLDARPADQQAIDPWAPSPAFRPDWVRAHRRGFDAIHVHFGFESRTPVQLAEWTDLLAREGIPLILTVHDLQLPHDRDHAAHRRRLAVLVAGATAVLTLTDGAAAEVGERYGRVAQVVPHPRMVPLHLIRSSVRTPPTRLRVGVHLKSLRPNGATPAWLLQVAAAVRDSCAAAELVVHVHDEVRDPGFVRYDARMLTVLDQLAEQADCRVQWTDRLTDQQLWAYLHSIQVSVLPHRWGSHSGWLEECLDLGVVPVVPRIGYLGEQFDRHTYRWAGETPDPASLRTAVSGALHEAAHGRDSAAATTWAEHRRRTDASSQAIHRRFYRQAVTGG